MHATINFDFAAQRACVSGCSVLRGDRHAVLHTLVVSANGGVVNSNASLHSVGAASLGVGCKLERQQMESKKEKKKKKISKMTGGVATNCDQIGKDITIWLKLGQQQMKSDEKKKKQKWGEILQFVI